MHEWVGGEGPLKCSGSLSSPSLFTHPLPLAICNPPAPCVILLHVGQAWPPQPRAHAKANIVCILHTCSIQNMVRHGPQPYAHVKANMVRLPYACSIGPDSLLHSLVESDVPVQVGVLVSCSYVFLRAGRAKAESAWAAQPGVYG
eukprot:scaffold206943_cov22-Tisochrysis_lutea.AAC.2